MDTDACLKNMAVTEANISHEVQLAIYDLSQGKALSLSARLLGLANYAVDIVPHTGLVVYGRFLI